MPNRVQCDKCGGKVDVPARHARPKIRCPHCGYYAIVPPDMRSAAPPDDDDTPRPTAPRATVVLVEDDDETPSPPPRRPAKANGKAKPAVLDPGPNMLEGSQDEDDDKPYAVPGDGTKKCPACRKELPLAAEFCVHCGGDLAAGKKKKRTFQPIDRTWESVATLSLRLKAFAGIQVMNVLMLANVSASGGSSAAYGMVFFNVLLQAFLVGTFEKLTVKRSAKGTAGLTKQWRVCFLPQPVAKIDWKKSHAVGRVAYHNPGCAEFGMLLFIFFAGFGQMAGWILTHEIDSAPRWLATLLIVFPVSFGPAAAWYWFVIRPERFEVALTDEYGSTNEVVFRTTDRDVADDICRTVADGTGLWYKPVM